MKIDSDETGLWWVTIQARTWEQAAELVCKTHETPPMGTELVEATITRGGEGQEGGGRCYADLLLRELKVFPDITTKSFVELTMAHREKAALEG